MEGRLRNDHTAFAQHQQAYHTTLPLTMAAFSLTDSQLLTLISEWVTTAPPKTDISSVLDLQLRAAMKRRLWEVWFAQRNVSCSVAKEVSCYNTFGSGPPPTSACQRSQVKQQAELQTSSVSSDQHRDVQRITALPIHACLSSIRSESAWIIPAAD